jgi:hypothetical protein
MTTRLRRGLKRVALALFVPFASCVAAHAVVVTTTPVEPPAIVLPPGQVEEQDGLRRVGPSYTRVRAGIREVFLRGTPEAIGAAHARLLRPRMEVNEAELWDTFRTFVPIAPVRTLLGDIARVRYRNVDHHIPEPRRRELAAEALAFQPDPYADHLPTYHRMVFLHALYDIALSFEHSPLIGCSVFGLGPTMTKSGRPLLARAFDFEAGEVFDRDKAVFFVAGDGAIPFASVAWPGLVGVMSGMNLEGVSVVVNGARGGEPTNEGLPVIFSLREVLERARTTDEAVAILRAQRVMVSHLVFVGDARGRYAIVERAPGHEAYVRPEAPDPSRVGLTNHFEGPLAEDPRNQTVLATTTTTARRARLEEMLASLPGGDADVARAVAMLRDHACANGEACALGDRRAIDAMIATHGIVADPVARTLWVSAGPNLSGKFVAFDLGRIFAEGHDPSRDPEPETVAEDPILFDGRYEEGRRRAGRPRLGGDAR